MLICFFVISLLEQIILRFLATPEQVFEYSDQDIHADGIARQVILMTSGNPRILDLVYVLITHSLQPETLPLRQPTETIFATLILKETDDVA